VAARRPVLAPGRAAPTGRVLATFRRRLGGFAIDMLILLAIVQVLAIVLYAQVDAESAASRDAALVRLGVANLLIRFGYNWYFNARGWSPGKRAVGLRIVTAAGEPPGVRRGLTRAAGAVLSELPLWIGYLWAAWGAGCQTWHDRMAGTWVVRADESDADPSRPGDDAGR